MIGPLPSPGQRLQRPANLWAEGNSRIRSSDKRVWHHCAQRCVIVKAGSSRDPYEVLGVKRGADARTIKAAYRKKALKLHPDVNKAPDAKEQFMAAKAAFQTLSDAPQGRASSTRQQQSSSSSNGYDWGNPFGRSPNTGGYQSTTGDFKYKKQEEEPFYGFTEFFEDLDKERSDRRKRRNKTDSSLWEELSDIGEEFVEFLENELGFDHKSATAAASSSDSTSRDAAAKRAASEQQRRDARQARVDAAARAEEEASNWARRTAEETKEKARKAEQDVDDMLADLKRKMKRS